MFIKITTALALALAVLSTVPAAAGPDSHETARYDASGVPVGPYGDYGR